ncbi:hypothetical protein HHK36_017896 [Tetracentron sinense]|uniref:UBA domain-containing protein n=1 Tax=Tetracentron sinense TaxID=13715 RepID=A0A834Z0I1_TETSI|nr:hypothetical protein HHK36_017896 [Tetracentron sinense]
MSPASRSKSKDKSFAKATKEQQKASSRPSGPANTGSGTPSSAYNPLSGTFHTLETVSIASSPPLHNNGRFRSIDETNEHSGSSLGTGAEYDTVSNNDSCSGESEDQKEKTASATVRQEAIPGSDNDKRDKVRQKNERKHQRQRERRAQGLHERCSGYLMSSKLEALAHQLVAMGFSSERATMALMLNEGKLEESVAWLFDGGEEAGQNKDSNLDGRSSLKIDIAGELAQIAEMEIRYKCTRQDVERAIVACEGDLEKAGESLRAQKQEQPTALPKQEETGDPSSADGGKVAVSITQNAVRSQTNLISSVTLEQKREERDFNDTKSAATVVPSPESGNPNLQSLRKMLPKEWARPQVATLADKRWPSSVSSPSISYSLASPLHVMPPPAKTEVKNIQPGTVREPVIMMQRPQSMNAKQNPAISISSNPPGTDGWYPNSVGSVEIMKSNASSQHLSSTTSISPNNRNSQHFYHQLQNQPHPFVSSSMDSTAAGWEGSMSRTGMSSSLRAVPSSLGLFSGWGPTGTSDSSSRVDWNTGGLMPQCDYTNIDWRLESTSSSRPSGLWLGLASFVKNNGMHDSWSPSTSAGAKPKIRSVNGAVGTDSSAGLHEWTSPFAGTDLFSIPRQFSTSPSL